MYVALRQLKVRQPDLSVLVIQPGEAVPNFDGWAYWTRKAHLDQEVVRWVDGEEGIAALHLPTRQVVQHFPAGPLPKVEEAPNPLLSEVFRPAVPDLRSATVRPEPTVEQPVAEAELAGPSSAAVATLMSEPLEPVGPGPDGVEANLTCGVCQQSGFKNLTGLRVHKARAHKA